MSRRLRRDLHKRISSAGYQKISGDLEVTGALIGPSMANVTTAIMKIVAGTTTPVQLTISRCEGAYKSIILQWLVQYNLMNFDHYEVQVSSDDTNWYSLKFDGTDWKDTLNADTDVVAPLIIHFPIPFGGTEDAPTAVMLYYRMRQKTILGVASAWSASVSSTTSLIQTGDLAANVVTANKIIAGTLQTQFLRIAGSVTIGYEGTGTIASPDEGDRRWFIDGDEISSVEYTAGGWSKVKQIRFGGVNSSGLYYPFSQCLGVLNPQADEVSAEFFPSAEFRVFNFENNYEDQDGVDDWTTKTNLLFNTTDKKFGSYSLTANTSGSGELLAPWGAANAGSSQSQGVLIQIKRSATPGNADAKEALLFFMIGGISPIDGIWLKAKWINNGANFDLRVYSHKSGSTVLDYTIDANLSFDTWHYVALIYNSDTDKVAVVYNTNIYTIGVLGGSWNTPGNGTTGLAPQIVDYVAQADDYCRHLFDEMLYAYDQYIAPDIFAQHYNHNIAWNTDVSAKDILLKPASGGNVVIEKSKTTAKAWVNFNGTGTVAIRDSFNVSSITDNGVGDYTVNFTNAMDDANYCTVVTGRPGIIGSVDQVGGRQVASVQLNYHTYAGVVYDTDEATAVVFGS